MRTAELGFWWRSLGGAAPTRAPLQAPAAVDVAIVGAGFTGLWTAYYLKRADPSLQIVVLERELAGYGASGRNGGWVSGFFSGPARVYERRGGAEGFAALQRAMFDTVDEVGRAVDEQQIDADFLRGGQLSIALDEAQARRLAGEVASSRAHGLGEDDLRELSAGELAERVRVAGARRGVFTPHVARVHPAKLVSGLAAAVERLGVTIYERTPVLEIQPHAALTPAGRVRARWVVRATEGYTAGLPGLRRALVPMNSSMIVTEPLPAQAWEEIGWSGREALSDAAHVYVYLQRTEDGRIAIGGRGVPYRFASRTDGAGDTAATTVASLRSKLVEMFPAAAEVDIDHAWSGVLGVPRDWCISLDADRRTGLAWAGGYVGEGVAAANLAGRTLRDLLLGERSELTQLPWVGRAPRRWEPEPLRWAEIHAVYSLYRRADREERRSGSPSRLGRLVDRLSGRH
ncbi:MAG TPA: FAD-dependent oxidoreductase [Solirubrobacteraceae bacterium]|jgi:glycine/D-amino acid oxidase-like deaminating enzyme|nr:FAD-dependent oxidoreductase [Solirubrobacteraceae bacterium]